MSENSKTITVRLPKGLIDILDKEVERRDTNRSDVIRRSILTYRRMRDGIFIPLASEYKRSLLEISERKGLPYEDVVSRWVCDGISRDGKQGSIRYTVTTNQTFEPEWADRNVNKDDIFDISTASSSSKAIYGN